MEPWELALLTQDVFGARGRRSRGPATVPGAPVASLPLGTPSHPTTTGRSHDEAP